MPPLSVLVISGAALESLSKGVAAARCSGTFVASRSTTAELPNGGCAFINRGLAIIVKKGRLHVQAMLHNILSSIR